MPEANLCTITTKGLAWPSAAVADTMKMDKPQLLSSLKTGDSVEVDLLRSIVNASPGLDISPRRPGVPQTFELNIG